MDAGDDLEECLEDEDAADEELAAENDGEARNWAFGRPGLSGDADSQPWRGSLCCCTTNQKVIPPAPKEKGLKDPPKQLVRMYADSCWPLEYIRRCLDPFC